jgi:hypothetical protein
MSMTKSEVLHAIADGKCVQEYRFCESLGSGGYHNLSESEVFELILAGELVESAIRLAPQPKRVHLSKDDCIGLVFRNRDSGFIYLPHAMMQSGVYIYNNWVSWELLAKSYEMSSDNGKTWNPCYKEVTE